jgi:hypothetical protein
MYCNLEKFGISSPIKLICVGELIQLIFIYLFMYFTAAKQGQLQPNKGNHNHSNNNNNNNNNNSIQSFNKKEKQYFKGIFLRVQ